MRVFIIKMLMKRCFAGELRTISQYADELIFQRISNTKKYKN